MSISSRSLFFLTVLFAGLAPSVAAAWGHQSDLRTANRQGFLVFSALDRGAIRYCLSVDPTARKRFDAASLNIQIRAGLQAWLNPAQWKSFVGHVNIEQVGCLDPELDLHVVIAPDRTSHAISSAQVRIERAGHKFSEIRINTAYRSSAGERITDLKTVLNLPDDPHLIQILDRFISIQGFSIATLSTEANVPAQKIFWSTYRILLHEIGRSFGLCDNAAKVAETNCDPEYLTAARSGSVMSDSAYLMLTVDDEEGLTKVFERFP